jgi:hypothetical protein
LGKQTKEVAFFEKKAPQKNFATFTRAVGTSPGSKKVFAELRAAMTERSEV